MPARKRGREEMEESEPPKETSLLERIRNMWEFAAIMQFIYLFGKALKIDEDFDIEDFETECLKPGYSEKLEEIGLTLLKWISSHRGLNYDIWDEYTRRQYLSKSPQSNPYGDEEEPRRFRDFDIFTKLRILHQLTIWAFWNPDRIRERMVDHPKETEQLEWRIEEIGYDREDRQYYLLDDNRLYRRTEPLIPPAPKAKPKSNTKKAQAERRRSNKRRRIVQSETSDVTGAEDDASSHIDQDEDQDQINGTVSTSPADVDTFGGFKWECIAITLTQYRDFCESLKKTKDPNEKTLRESVLNSVIPIIEAAEEKQRRKIERRERELLALEKLATAKRSSRIADKADRDRHEREAAEGERKRTRDLAEAHKQQELQEKMDRDRQSRMLTREQRIKDREFKRLLKEEEFAKATEEAKKLEAGEIRASERRLKDKMEQAKKDLEDLQNEDDWTFDCSGCGMYGKNIDDGSHSVACEKCSVWQHSKCLGVSIAAAEDENFHFVCKDCNRKEEEANQPKVTLKIRNPSSISPKQSKTSKQSTQSPTAQRFVGIDVPKKRGRPRKDAAIPNGTHAPAPVPKSTANSPPAPVQGYQFYTSRPTPAFPYEPQYGVQPNAYQPAYPNVASPPPPLQNGYHPRPGSSGHVYPPHQQQQTAPSMHASSHSPPSYPAYPPYYNNTPHQYPPYPATQRSHHSPTNRPGSSHGAMNGMPPTNEQRLPSPIVNRPSMSPTQGNYDVGRVAGVQQKSPPPPYQQSLSNATAQRPYNSQSHHGQINGVNRPSQMDGPVQLPNQSHLSGLSPTKHSPIPPPSAIPTKLSMSPSPYQHQSHPPLGTSPSMRSVSGTTIYPPSERLAPSPDQLRKTPMPTPSKHSLSPEMRSMDQDQQMGREELRRVNEEIKENLQMSPSLPTKVEVDIVGSHIAHGYERSG